MNKSVDHEIRNSNKFSGHGYCPSIFYISRNFEVKVQKKLAPLIYLGHTTFLGQKLYDGIYDLKFDETPQHCTFPLLSDKANIF